MKIEVTLERIGFGKKEITIFITLLKLGLAKASRIAKDSGIERRTVYGILDRLKQKHIVFSVIKNGVQHFKATDPKKILEELNETKRMYLEALPKLMELSNLPKEEIKIDILAGKEGLRTIFNDILKQEENIINFGGFTKYDKTDYILFSQLVRDMQKLRLKERVLVPSGVKIVKISSGEYKTINLDQDIPTSTIIYGNKVAITIFAQKTYSIVRIENKDFTDSYRKYFEHYWKISK